MLAEERRARILAEIRHHGAARVGDLAALFGVSEMTIRRDLDALADRRAVVKVHGGATAAGDPRAHEPGFHAKSTRQRAEKRAIAAAAAQFAQPGAAIGLSGGTTTWELAPLLSDIPDLVVVTNSMRVAEVLHEVSQHEVILTGGVRTPSDALVGPLAVAALSRLNLDVVFLGAHGVDARVGFTTPNLLEAETNAAMVGAGKQLVVLADHTKWGVVGLSQIAPLDRADVFVTDDGLAEGDRAELAGHVGELVVASASAWQATAQTGGAA